MILRPIDDVSASAADAAPVNVWHLLQRSQVQPLHECWLITQPAHAALSGEIAEALAPEAFGKIEPLIARAIAMHDYGWSGPDAAAIQSSRAGKPGKTAMPYSFIAITEQEAASIWTTSIEAAEKVSPTGGWIVAEHFLRIGQMDPRMKSPTGAAFEKQERGRQARLRPKIQVADGELLRLVDALQFCDLLSLYICAGIEEAAEFPQTIGGKPICLLRDDDPESCRLEPNPFTGPQLFSIAAIRHPKLGGTAPNSAMFALTVSV